MEAKIKRFRHFLGGAVAICWSSFQIYGAWDVTLDAMILRAGHVGFALCLVFLLNPSFKSKPRLSLAIDSLLVFLGIGVGVHIITDFDRIIQRVISVDEMTLGDLFFGSLALPLILEATRRAVRAALAVVGLCFCLYALIGPYLFGALKHSAANLSEWIEYLYLTTEGIFGIPTGVSATFVFLFILFVAFLQRTDVGKFYLDMAFGLTGRSRGGAAKAAVVASSFFGTISGSAVANTVGTGTFTIPLIIRGGYKPYFAGAVEALSSTGGQIMPPIMGAAAFVMAEITGIPYWDICKAAAFPAILFYGSVFVMVHLEAVRTGVMGLSQEELPNLRETLRKGWFLISPIIVLVAFLALQYTVTKACLMAIVSTILVFLIHRRTLDALRRMGRDLSRGVRDGVRSIFREVSFVLVSLGETLDQGAKMALTVAVACICAGIIVGVITLSGLGLRFSGMISALAGNSVLLALLFVAVSSIILGMGMSTTANYITVAALAVPALYILNVNTLSAHMFAFYFSCLSMITPPVALAAYAAAGIAQTSPWRVGFTAMRLGMVAFIIPFMYAYNPALLLIGPLSSVVRACMTAAIGVIALSAGIMGYLYHRTTWVERILLGLAGLLLIKPGFTSDLIGLPIFAVVIAWQYFTSRGKNRLYRDGEK